MKTDMRTRQGREEQIRERVKKYGGFFRSWIKEDKKRQTAAKRMIDSGEIKATVGSSPWIVVRLAKPKTKQ